MRKILFVILMSLISLPAMADLAREEMTETEYLINAGYSQATAEDVFVMKNRALGKPIEPLYETSDNFIVRGWRKFYSYIDPAQATVDKIHHDIQLAPSASDL